MQIALLVAVSITVFPERRYIVTQHVLFVNVNLKSTDNLNSDFFISNIVKIIQININKKYL